MSLTKKLALARGDKLRVLGKPANVAVDDAVMTRSAKETALLVFVRTRDELDDVCEIVADVCRSGGPTWIAYPKAGQLDTDLSRDVIRRYMLKYYIVCVGQIAIDPIWSAMRFRAKR